MANARSAQEKRSAEAIFTGRPVLNGDCVFIGVEGGTFWQAVVVGADKQLAKAKKSVSKKSVSPASKNSGGSASKNSGSSASPVSVVCRKFCTVVYRDGMISRVCEDVTFFADFADKAERNRASCYAWGYRLLEAMIAKWSNRPMEKWLTRFFHESTSTWERLCGQAAWSVVQDFQPEGGKPMQLVGYVKHFMATGSAAANATSKDFPRGYPPPNKDDAGYPLGVRTHSMNFALRTWILADFSSTTLPPGFVTLDVSIPLLWLYLIDSQHLLLLYHLQFFF